MVQAIRQLHCAGLVAAAMVIAVGNVAADSGLVGDSIQNNALNYGLLPPGATIEALGLSVIKQTSFSPSGILYPLVWQNQPPPEGDADGRSKGSDEQGGTVGAWAFDGLLEFGYLANFGTTDSARFLEFADWDEAPLLSRFALRGDDSVRGQSLRIAGASLGRDDQFVRLDFERHGEFAISGWFNQIPHTFATNARVLWDSAGSGELTLPGDLQPGSVSAQSVRELVFERPESTLKLERKRGGLAVTLTPARSLELFFRSTGEWRDGARGFGGTFNYPTLGQSMETIEPINYFTFDIDTGLRYAGSDYQANLVYNSSYFSNATESLVWENPGLAPFVPDFVPARGRTALAPDNQFHQLNGDIALALPFWNARWTASAAFNRKTQDQRLLPPTISTGTGNNAGTPVDFDLWNTSAALSRPRADARIETFFAQSELALQPLRRLRAALEWRYVDEDNDTNYTAFNPLTGEFGYIPEDGGFLFNDGIFQPGRPGELLRIRNVPHATDEAHLRIQLDYRPSARTRLGLTMSHLEEDHAHRERGEVRDNRIRLQLSERGGPWASLRLSGEYAHRTGDDYIRDPLAPFRTSSLQGFVPRFDDGPEPLELADLRVFDLASRDQYVADLQLRFNPGLRSDLALNASYQHDDFDADFGLRHAERLDANAEWNYQFDSQGSGYVYYSFQSHQREASGINDAGATAADPFAGGEVFPLSNAWRQNLDERQHAVGIGVTRQWNTLLLEADYTFNYTRSELGQEFNTAGALAFGVDPGAARQGLPDQTFEQHVLRLSARYPISERVAARVFYRLEAENIDDFHSDGLDDPVLDNQLFLLTVPEDFTAHVLGLLVEVRL